MKNIKQQFSDLRKTTPKHVQWLLLIAAFIVVIILLTLLLTGKKKDTAAAVVGTTDDVPAEISLAPDMLDWSNTHVDEKQTATIDLTATAPVKIMDVRLNKDAAGLTFKTNCITAGEVTPALPCTITLEYAPTAPADAGAVSVLVDWRGGQETDEMKKTQRMIVSLGASAPAPFIEPDPTPVADEKPQSQPAQAPAVTPAPVETLTPAAAPTTVKEEIKRDIESIAPSYTLDAAPSQSADKSVIAPEACSDFAFPGYDTSGNQIGWIKPERGAYYFHPFSDKNCDSPTGVYNPDNGIITDIKNSGKKIGTDADHIGYTTISAGMIPQLSNAPTARRENRARQLTTDELSTMTGGQMAAIALEAEEKPDVAYTSSGTDTVVSSRIYDRRFILRQYKPIPATIVSDVRADAVLEGGDARFPVRATVDRNVYADNGRTIIIPTGTLLLGYVTGNVPGPYKAIGRMQIKWYQFVLPNGVEFNFKGDKTDPFSADAQGRVGVPGRGSTDYLEQFVMPMLTAIVPAAVNMIAPVADKFVNQIDLDNNTVVQSGTVRSSELAKNEIITAWNQVAQKLMVDMMDNTVPPFTIAAGTRITVYSPVDLQVSCGEEGGDKACSVGYGSEERAMPDWESATVNYNDGSWVGQARSFNMAQYCTQNSKGVWEVNSSMAQTITQNSGYSYSTVAAYCQSMNYEAKNNVIQNAVFENQQSASNKNSIASIGGGGSTTNLTQQYNENVLGLKYDEDTGAIENPFQSSAPAADAAPVVLCPDDGTVPDANGCCTGEVYTDMGEQGFNCCPSSGGDCFPPIL